MYQLVKVVGLENLSSTRIKALQWSIRLMIGRSFNMEYENLYQSLFIHQLMH